MTQRRGIEWPTVVLAGAIHGIWLLVILGHRHTPWWAEISILAVTLAWHGSLQHEVLHGHPFRRQFANDVVGSVPLALRLPYPVYRRQHLEHHRCESLTDPLDDAESFYLTTDSWRRIPSVGRLFRLAYNTLLGRLVLGPACELVSVPRRQLAEIRRGDRQLVRWWALHAVSVAALLTFVVGVQGFPLWVYLVGVYAGHSLSLVRSYCEHRWVPGEASRSAVVRSGWFFSMIFLHNNLHHTHHARPAVAWYRLPALADQLGSDEAARAGAGWYSGYGDVARRYLVRPYDHPVHPPQRRRALRSGSASTLQGE